MIKLTNLAGIALGTLLCTSLLCPTAKAQLGPQTQWAPDGKHFYANQNNQIYLIDAATNQPGAPIVSSDALAAAGQAGLSIRRFSFSANGQQVLINNNTQRVWRYDTRGDYWVYNLSTKTLKKLGKGLPASSLMFAKFSPDGQSVAYVSGHNIFVEGTDASAAPQQLTQDGSTKLINGTFDWAYEEEFNCRDGFRWSPDSKSIAYWQIDARKIKNYLMLNTTDSIYPYVVPVEYPTAGQDPSSCRVGVLDVANGHTTWMAVPGDAVQHYIPRMEWTLASNKIILQQLNRAQTQSVIYVCDAQNGQAKAIYTETDKAWIDIKTRWNEDKDYTGWDWIENGKSFIWGSEQDGWLHLYKIGLDGSAKLLTPGKYDVTELNLIDEAHHCLYITASPNNPTQRYLFKVPLRGGAPQRLTPANQPGTHGYDISPTGSIARHLFNNSYTPYKFEIVSLPKHEHVSGDVIVVDSLHKPANAPEFFRVTTSEGVVIDGWMKKPNHFDATKKYPVLFYVYGEPASQVVTDTYGAGRNRMYTGSMADDGYIYIAMDNRGSPAPRGAAWRKAIYRNIGTLNIRDQALAATEVLKWPFVDSTRVAVWGWSGGGSSTLNLLFQYPKIYKTGIAIAAVDWQLTYDNIYQERYMGVPTDAEGRSYFIKGSPVTYAKNLQGNLLYIHGTGDDNVHYQNAEMLINELVKYNKQFDLMLYPNRTHAIREGEGTSLHLQTLFTRYLKAHCPPGGR